MFPSVFLSGVGLLLFGGVFAQGDVTKPLLSKIIDEIPAKIEISPFSYTWIDRTLWIFKEQCSMNCSRGTAWTLKGLEQVGASAVRDSSVFAFLYFTGVQFNYDDCIMRLHQTTGEEHEYGMIGDHRLNLEASTQAVGDSQCKLTISKFVFEYLESVLVNESANMKFLKSFNQFENVREKIRSTIEESIGTELSKFVGKSYIIDAPCK